MVEEAKAKPASAAWKEHVTQAEQVSQATKGITEH